MLLFLLSPRLYAHSFFNSKDAVFASAFVMALLVVSRAFDRDSVGAYRWCGAAAGLLVNLRIMGVVLFAARVGLPRLGLVSGRGGSWRGGGRRRPLGASSCGGALFCSSACPISGGTPQGVFQNIGQRWPTILSCTLANCSGVKCFPNAALPWDYVLHWFAISQPPVTLLLGLLGLGTLGLAAGGVVRRGADAGPGAAWGGADLRFGVLLATCFALPLVAFALLRPTTLDSWRHFYFLHGPFCLLATFALMGLRQLSARRARKGWVGGVACALTAAGLCVVVVQMAQIHPHQYLYFNFFVDRKTPERLRTRYTMDHWDMAMRQGYEYLLRQTPAAAINMEKQYLISRLNLSKMILPAADRRRLTHDPSRDADFYLSGSTRQSFLLKEPFPPALHRFKVYNNTMLIVSTPDLSRVDPAVAEAYRALHRAATAGTPVARAGGFDAHLHGNRLAWVKEACEPGALRREFLLKLYPMDPGRLPESRRRWGYFELYARGVRFDSKCLGAWRGCRTSP